MNSTSKAQINAVVMAATNDAILTDMMRDNNLCEEAYARGAEAMRRVAIKAMEGKLEPRDYAEYVTLMRTLTIEPLFTSEK